MKIKIYLIFCLILGSFASRIAFSSPMLEKAEIGEHFVYLRPVDEKQLSSFIETVISLAAEQSLEAGWFSSKEEAYASLKEEEDILYVLENPSVLEKSFFYEDFYQAWKEENFLFYLYLDNEETPCGYCWYSIDLEYHDAFIRAIFIEHDYRRMGLATKVLTNLAKELKEQGIKYMELHVFRYNSAACQLYEKLGYKKTENGPKGKSTFYMKKKLKD